MGEWVAKRLGISPEPRKSLFLGMYPKEMGKCTQKVLIGALFIRAKR